MFQSLPYFLTIYEYICSMWYLESFLEILYPVHNTCFGQPSFHVLDISSLEDQSLIHNMIKTFGILNLSFDASVIARFNFFNF